VSDLPKEIFSGYSIVGSSTYLVIDDRGVVKYRANGFYEAAMSAKIKELL